MLTSNVIMPVLGMIQDSGKIIKWLVREGQAVQKGEPLFEVETDKAVAEIESPASGILSNVTAQEGDDVPVGNVIALILEKQPDGGGTQLHTDLPEPQKKPVTASPLAARMAAEHKLELDIIRPQGGKVEKEDVLAYLQKKSEIQQAQSESQRLLASPKARRLALENSVVLTAVRGSGPGGAVLSSDVISSIPAVSSETPFAPAETPRDLETAKESSDLSQTWRIMAERTAAAWREIPHFFLLREVEATRLIAWKDAIEKIQGVRVTYTDLLVKLVAEALKRHPGINAVYQDGRLILIPTIHVGIAVAIEDGLVVPVIQNANSLSISKIAAERVALVERARTGRLRPADISKGTFTISNLGMFGVDAFLAVINPPQAAILAVGRIADRVMPVGGQVVIRPAFNISLSFDHRAVDGARGAIFLDTLVALIEEPLGIIS
jgi:pyruvate dehydrogenase E2 component (dihydrolipoamide acetyltransferase)